MTTADTTSSQTTTATADTADVLARQTAARAFVKSLPKEQQVLCGIPIDFYEQFPLLPAILSRVGNSHVGVAPEDRARFQDGARIRTSWPATLQRVAVETHANGDRFVRTLTGWAEGRWHTVWWSMEGRYIGGHFDFPWDDRTPPGSDQGYGCDLIGYSADGFVGETAIRAEGGNPGTRVTITEIPPNDAKAVPGYYWSNAPLSCELRTPQFHGYSVDPFDAAHPDPVNPNRLFTAQSVFSLDWTKPGDGQEYRSHRSTVDLVRFPTDPRLDPADGYHVRAVRSVGGQTYLYTGGNAGSHTLIHRWDNDSGVMTPVLALYVSPGAPACLAGVPAYDWSRGQGVLWRDGASSSNSGNSGNSGRGDGISDASEFTLYPASCPSPLYYLWNDFRVDIDMDGQICWFPIRGAGTAGLNLRPVVRWNPLDPAKPTPAPVNVDLLSLPDALVTGTADAVECLKVNWKSGDLYAAVRRKLPGAGGFEWRLERYAGWAAAADKARKAKKAAYSVSLLATNVRREYESMSPHHEAFDCCYEAGQGAMKGALGSLVAEGDYVFVAEAQGCGVRVYRAKDGKALGRLTSTLTPNATQDCPTAFHVWQAGSGDSTEYRITVQDFHGSNVLWRVMKKDLAAAGK